jgi:hypothetical protein
LDGPPNRSEIGTSARGLDGSRPDVEERRGENIGEKWRASDNGAPEMNSRKFFAEIEDCHFHDA